MNNDVKKGFLIKKLAKVKLNKSRGRLSGDLSSFYEARYRKLRFNNSNLAKSLAEQRTLTQSWCKEVVSMKSELQEFREKLLGYQIADQGHYEEAIGTEVNRRLRNVCDPLQEAITTSLDNVIGMADSITKVKKLVSSLIRIPNERNSSICTYLQKNPVPNSNSNPPLAHTPRSPRRNVVHPMVEGHTLQPATININRISLEDMRHLRMQNRAEMREEAGLEMSIIGEQSVSFNQDNSIFNEEEESVEPSEPIISEENSLQDAEITLPDTTASPSIDEPSADNTDETLTTVEEEHENSEIAPADSLRTFAVTSTIEDPLEGSSWMTKRQRKSRHRTHNSSICLVFQSSSDSDSEDLKIPKKDRKKKRRKTIHKMNNIKVVSSSPSVTIISSPIPRRMRTRRSLPNKMNETNIYPTIKLVRLDGFKNHTSNIGRRSKKKSTASRASTEEIPDSPRMLESFLIADETIDFKMPLPVINKVKEQSFSVSPVKTKTNLDQVTESPLNVSSNDIPAFPARNAFNDTCLDDSSMEFTCLPPIPTLKVNENLENTEYSSNKIPRIISDIENSKINCSVDLKRNNIPKYLKENADKNMNKFFVSDYVKINSGTSAKIPTPFDLSLMEKTIPIQPYIHEKENVPPEIDDSISDIKDVSIVVKDIMQISSNCNDDLIALVEPTDINIMASPQSKGNFALPRSASLRRGKTRTSILKLGDSKESPKSRKDTRISRRPRMITFKGDYDELNSLSPAHGKKVGGNVAKKKSIKEIKCNSKAKLKKYLIGHSDDMECTTLSPLNSEVEQVLFDGNEAKKTCHIEAISDEIEDVLGEEKNNNDNILPSLKFDDCQPAASNLLESCPPPSRDSIINGKEDNKNKIVDEINIKTKKKRGRPKSKKVRISSKRVKSSSDDCKFEALDEAVILGDHLSTDEDELLKESNMIIDELSKQKCSPSTDADQNIESPITGSDINLRRGRLYSDCLNNSALIAPNSVSCGSSKRILNDTHSDDEIDFNGFGKHVVEVEEPKEIKETSTDTSNPMLNTDNFTLIVPRLSITDLPPKIKIEQFTPSSKMDILPEPVHSKEDDLPLGEFKESAPSSKSKKSVNRRKNNSKAGVSLAINEVVNHDLGNANILVKEEPIDSISQNEEEFLPRKRRAASKISSFKEASLNAKMRR